MTMTALTVSDGVADDGKGRLSGSVELLLENTFEHEAGAQADNLVVESDADITLSITERINISTEVLVEQIEDGKNSGLNVLSGEGAYLESLLLNYDGGMFSVFAGRFSPNVFDDRFDYLPELWSSTDLQDDLEITGALGFGGHVDFRHESYGTHRLEASLYTADRTVLSDSLITSVGRRKLSDGGLANAEGLSSFVIALHGGSIRGLDGVSYHIGMTGQKADLIFDSNGVAVADSADEYRIRATVQKERMLKNGLNLTILADFVHYWNSAGFHGASRDYLTGAGQELRKTPGQSKSAPPAAGSTTRTERTMTITRSGSLTDMISIMISPPRSAGRSADMNGR